MFNIFKSSHFKKVKGENDVDKLFTALVFHSKHLDLCTINTNHDTTEAIYEILEYADCEKIEKLEEGFYLITYTYKYSYDSYLNEGDTYISVQSIKPVDVYAKNTAIPMEVRNV